MDTLVDPENNPKEPLSENQDDLSHKLIEMQTRVSELEIELDSYRNPAKASLKTWISRLILVVILGIAAIPPAMVVAQQWFNNFPGDYHRDLWCRVDFLCNTMLPSYFSVTIGCFLILAITLFFMARKPIAVIENKLLLFDDFQIDPAQTRIAKYLLIASGLGLVGVIILSLITQHFPGWDLLIVWLVFLAGLTMRAIPAAGVVAFLKKDGELWVSLLLLHVAIIVMLDAYNELNQFLTLAILFLFLTFLNLWRFRNRVPVIYWIFSITLLFYSININAWWVSVIGDEYNFHDLAKRIVDNMNFSQVGDILFKGDGVYGTHPYLSSVLQAISMKFLGTQNFGWRFSSLYLSALGVVFFYFFCKSFLAKKPALVATILLAVSHYVMSFGKIGYNNLQALFALSLALAAASWALRQKQYFVFALLGSVLAFCFYLYPAALYVIPAPLTLLLFYYPPLSRKALSHWAVMLMTWLVMLYPLLMQPLYWQTKLTGTLFNRPDLVQSGAAVSLHFSQNLLYAFVSYLYIQESHFIAVSYVDPLSAVFITLGLFVLLRQVRNNKFSVFVALMYVIFLLLVGVSHDKVTPPNTRMFLMLPWFSLIGMWGIMWVEGCLKELELSRFKPVSHYLISVILVAVTATNLVQAYKISDMHYAGSQSIDSLFIGITHNIFNAEPDSSKNVVVIAGDTWGIDNILLFQKTYPHLAWFYPQVIRIKQAVLPDADISLLSDRNTIIIVSPYMDPAIQQALDAPLLALGKAHCDILTADGQKQFVLYNSPDLPSACPDFRNVK